MNKKKVKKIIYIVVILMIVMCFNNCYATSQLDQYKGQVSLGENGAAVQDVVSAILKVVQTVGAIISIVVLIVIGIKYMFGSVEEKAEYKKKLIPYLVGAIILFGGTLVPSLIYEFSTSTITNNTGGGEILDVTDMFLM